MILLILLLFCYSWSTISCQSCQLAVEHFFSVIVRNFIRLVIAYFSINLWFIITRIFHFAFKKIACNFSYDFSFFSLKIFCFYSVFVCDFHSFSFHIKSINVLIGFVERNSNNNNYSQKLLLIHYCLRWKIGSNVWLCLAFFLSCFPIIVQKKTTTIINVVS